MTDTERKEWLSSLKEGDKVYNIVYSYSYLSGIKEYTIKKITPTGKIRLDDGTLCEPDGVYSKFDRWQSVRIEIRPWDEKVEQAAQEIKAKNTWNKCKDIIGDLKLSELKLEPLLKIKDILESMKCE